ncbi:MULTISPECIES: FUSC family protein [Bacillus]|uniref:FUSC family protein n=1 Tax=Bacillus TaxID=1386 RepID=UPI0002FC1413|nr:MULTISPECIES: FUSC family protein [Bacillus]
MKKLIISKTIIFIFIILFVTGFQSVFGSENALIAVTTVVALLMFLERDLTVHPWKYLFLFILLNLQQGIFGYISTVNMWIGIPLNFISMFIVGYFFTYNLKKPIYIAFGLQYLFILTTPITYDQLPMRLLSLVVGACIIILVQLLANKNKLLKAGNKHMITVCDQLIKKIERMEKNEVDGEINKSIENAIKEFRKIVYFRRYKGYYLTNEDRIKLKISVCLEKLNYIFDRFIEDKHKMELLKALKVEIEHIKAYISNGTMPATEMSALKEIKKINNSTYIYEIISTLEFINEFWKTVYSMDKKELNKVEKLMEIPNEYKSSHNHINNLNRDSVRYSYAFRLGIAITATVFISDYFGFTEGKWMVFTLFSVTQPYSEQALYRFRERIIGTLMGAVIFIALFSIFTDTTTRSFLVLLFGYLNSYAVAYRNVVWTVTLAALGTAALTGNPEILTINRVFFVLLGIAIGMLVNKFILPFSLKTGTKNLIDMYREASKQMFKEVYKYLDQRENAHTINNLFAVSTLIEDRILLNNETLELKESKQFLEEQRKLNHAIYELFLRVQQAKISEATVKLVLEDVDRKISTSTEDIDCIVQEMKKKISTFISVEDKIIFTDILRIFKRFKKNVLVE